MEYSRSVVCPHCFRTRAEVQKTYLHRSIGHLDIYCCYACAEDGWVDKQIEEFVRHGLLRLLEKGKGDGA